jgi:GT2 family glycosyltransferase
MILGVPTLNRYELLDVMLRSADGGRLRPTRYVVVDNGGEYSAERANKAVDRELPLTLIKPERNLGVAASWNTILDAAGDEDVIVASDDMIFAPTNVDSFMRAMDGGADVVSSIDLALFAVKRDFVEKVGYADENFYPLWYEDFDLHHRMNLAGMKIVEIEKPLYHFVSATSGKMKQFLPKSATYFKLKWGSTRAGEFWSKPFNGAEPPRGWSLRPISGGKR